MNVITSTFNIVSCFYIPTKCTSTTLLRPRWICAGPEVGNRKVHLHVDDAMFKALSREKRTQSPEASEAEDRRTYKRMEPFRPKGSPAHTFPDRKLGGFPAQPNRKVDGLPNRKLDLRIDECFVNDPEKKIHWSPTHLKEQNNQKKMLEKLKALNTLKKPRKMIKSLDQETVKEVKSWKNKKSSKDRLDET